MAHITHIFEMITKTSGRIYIFATRRWYDVKVNKGRWPRMSVDMPNGKTAKGACAPDIAKSILKQI